MLSHSRSSRIEAVSGANEMRVSVRVMTWVDVETVCCWVWQEERRRRIRRIGSLGFIVGLGV